MKKKMPVSKTDEEAERFAETADLGSYDLSGFKPVRFEFAKKSAQLNMRDFEPFGVETVDPFAARTDTRL